MFITIDEWRKLKADRAELLEALEYLLSWVEDELRICESDAGAKARAATAKHKAGKEG